MSMADAALRSIRNQFAKVPDEHDREWLAHQLLTDHELPFRRICANVSAMVSAGARADERSKPRKRGKPVAVANADRDRTAWILVRWQRKTFATVAARWQREYASMKTKDLADVEDLVKKAVKRYDTRQERERRDRAAAWRAAVQDVFTHPLNGERITGGR
jgi:hypothetical protein